MAQPHLWGTIGGMHESAARLYQAALEMRGVEGQTRLASLLGQVAQVVNNWEARGVSKEGALLAQREIGCDANWLLTGEGSMQAGWPFKRVPLARVLALDSETLAFVEGRMLSVLEDSEHQTIPLTAKERVLLQNAKVDITKVPNHR
jgi:hypothetical protein